MVPERRDAGDAALLDEDARARAAALDVTRSFLVQAPAGSGKTELLIQRFLALLAGVDEPERIVALTFTRKAAGEMRERIVSALAQAAQPAAAPPPKPHERVTRMLAEQALAHDARRGWSLAQHPARLRILTFDSLTTWIVRSAPFAAVLGPAPAYTDDARGLYAAAAVEAIVGAAADDPHWQRLLVHLHNDADRAAELLAALLAKRDPWLRQIGVGDAAAVHAGLVDALADEAQAALAALARALPGDMAREIVALARLASGRLDGNADLAQRLADCAMGEAAPAFDLASLPRWRTLGAWLLTREGEPRSRIDKSIGFPAPGRDIAKADAKRRMEALVARLRDNPGLAATLHEVATMPSPAPLGAEAAAVVDALLAVVPRAVAQLRVTFAERGEVDFAQAGIAALAALGEPDAPSDLLQRLDYRLAHLLVDEFQDTSASQLALLARLTAGWTPGEDGRTLFAVGDPMQSIYRFREAEVRLFVEAQLANEVAGVPVQCLTLRRNFRAQKRLVDWVNDVFPHVLGRVSDPVRGAVAFEPAAAVWPALPGEGVTIDLAEDARAEARAVVARVQQAVARGACEIAILVRARAHLATILPALREAGIGFAAVELDRLAQRQAVQDLLALTHALLQPGDRLAWLAILRAPWCGLALADLVALAQAVPPPLPIVAALRATAVLAALSADGGERLGRVGAVLSDAYAAHGRAGVAARVRGAWLALGGPACLDDAQDLAAADRYFDVLARHERAGDVPEWSVFTAALEELTAEPDPGPGTAVQVMTMHKAKGLQFDTVILAGLGSEGRSERTALVRWRSRARGLLIAPSPSPGADADPVYAYLGRLDEEEAAAELRRLLYVACTRARSHLHLIAAPGSKAKKDGSLVWRVPSTSSLACLWPVLGERVAPPGVAPRAPDEALARPLLCRVPAGFAVAPADAGLAVGAAIGADARVDVPFDWAQARARIVGTLAHRLLARLPEAMPGAAPRVRADLAAAGFSAEECDAYAEQVLSAVHRTLADARGRWLFDPRHAEARSEWALAGLDGGNLVHVVLDRTFVANGVRWIVDFKTGTHEGGDVAGFLAREAERYRPQLQRYGRLAHTLDGRPVRLALYYPLIDGGWCEIVPGADA